MLASLAFSLPMHVLADFGCHRRLLWEFVILFLSWMSLGSASCCALNRLHPKEVCSLQAWAFCVACAFRMVRQQIAKLREAKGQAAALPQEAEKGKRSRALDVVISAAELLGDSGDEDDADEDENVE